MQVHPRQHVFRLGAEDHDHAPDRRRRHRPHGVLEERPPVEEGKLLPAPEAAGGAGGQDDPTDHAPTSWIRPEI